MEQQYLIDSNCIIYYLGNQLPANGTEWMKTLVDARPYLSVITKIEVLGFNASPGDAAVFNSFVKDSVVFELTTEVVDETIAIRKSCRIKLPDAIIAATALVNEMILVTRNTDDFTMIDGLQTINPFSL